MMQSYGQSTPRLGKTTGKKQPKPSKPKGK